MMKHLFAAVLLSTSVSLNAQSLSQTIVVTSSSLPETVEQTPAAVSVITKDAIDDRAARDIADMLREVPGVAVARTGTSGKATSLFIRGGSSKQALVLWNGVEINYPEHSGYNFGQFSTAGVERIEVVRGPFSALYGSEAVSGVVNVLTTPTRSGASLEIEGGERSLFNALATGSYARDRWNLNGTVERRIDDGFDANDDFAATSLVGGATVQPVEGLSLGLLARHAEYELGIPRVPNAESTAFIASLRRREEGTETQFVAPVRFDRGGLAAELRIAESRRSEDFSDPEGTFGPELTTSDSRVRSSRATVRFPTRAGTIAVGGEYEEALVDHQSAFVAIDSRERTSSAAFVEDRISFASQHHGSFELSAGLRLDDFDTFGSELSPRIAGAWFRSGNKIRAAYGEGFRAPGIGELYSPYFGNPALLPEQSRTVEVGYDRFFTSGLISITMFDSSFEDLIFFASDFTYQNIRSATARGVEVSAERRAGRWETAASYTLLDTEDESTGETLARRPEHSGSVSLGYLAGPLHTQLVANHTGVRNDVTDLLPFGTVTSKAYTTADLLFRYEVGSFAPFVKVENITGNEYEEVFGYPSPGRRVRVGVRLRR